MMKHLKWSVALSAVLAFTATPATAADGQHLTCDEISMSGRLFINGPADTRQYHRTLEVQIAADQATVEVSDNYGDKFNSGLFPLTISDAAYQWNGRIADPKTGFSHFVLDRYTLGMRSIETPAPGGTVLDVTINYTCRKGEKQI
jgi:hypothetical protein